MGQDQLQKSLIALSIVIIASGIVVISATRAPEATARQFHKFHVSYEMAKTKVATFFGYDFSNREVEYETIPLETQEPAKAAPVKDLRAIDPKRVNAAADAKAKAQKEALKRKAQAQLQTRVIEKSNRFGKTYERGLPSSDLVDAEATYADTFVPVANMKANNKKQEVQNNEEPAKKSPLSAAEISQLASNPSPQNLAALMLARNEGRITDDQYLTVVHAWLQSKSGNRLTSQNLGLQALIGFTSARAFRLIVESSENLDASLVGNPNSLAMQAMNQYIHTSKRSVLAQILVTDPNPKVVSTALSLIQKALGVVTLENGQSTQFQAYYGQPKTFLVLTNALNTLVSSNNTTVSGQAQAILSSLRQYVPTN